MGRKAFVSIEIDFLFGLDGKGFIRLTSTQRMAYFTLWAYLWHNHNDPTISLVDARQVLRQALINPKHLHKMLTKIREIGLIEYDGEKIKFLELQEKRQKAFGLKTPKQYNQAGTKEKVKKKVNKEEEEKKKNPRGVEKIEGKTASRKNGTNTIFDELEEDQRLNPYDWSIVDMLLDEKIDGPGIFSAVFAVLVKGGIKYSKDSELIGTILNTAFCDMPKDESVIDMDAYIVTIALNIARKKVEDKEEIKRVKNREKIKGVENNKNVKWFGGGS